MEDVRTRVLTLAMTVATVMSLAPTTAGSAATAGVAIDGHVTAGDTGTGLADVCVSAYEADSYTVLASGVTDANGDYHLSPVSEGQRHLRFEDCGGTGYLGQWYDGAENKSGATPVTVAASGATVDAVLVPGASVSGTVRGPDGGPVADACVDVTRVQDGTYRYLAGTMSGTDGTYRVDSLPAGPAVVSFSPCGTEQFVAEYFDGVLRRDDATVLDLVAGEERSGVDASVEAGGTISGTVLDVDGEPVPDVCVQAEESDLPFYRSDWTDDAGRYRIDGLPAGSYRVSFAGCGGPYLESYHGGPDRDSATLLPVADGAEVDGVDAVLIRGAVISGTVSSATSGGALDGVCVSAQGVEGGFGWGRTGPSGHFDIDGLASDSYRISYSWCGDGAGFVPEYHDDTRSWSDATLVPVVAGEHVEGLSAALLPAASVSGTVTDATGAPLADVCVRAAPVGDGGSWGSSTRTDDDGSYVLAGVSAGEVKISFEDCGDRGLLTTWYREAGSEGTASVVRLAPGAVVTDIDGRLTELGGEIAGTVTRDDDGTPVPGACVDVERVSDTGGGWGWGVADTAGAYVVRGLEPGDYIVSFHPCNDAFDLVSEYYDDAATSDTATLVTVTAGSRREGVDAGLARGGRISGTVTGASGSALADVCVSAYEMTTARGAWARTGSDGSYVLQHVTEGDHRVRFRDCSGGDHQPEWYDDRSLEEDALPVAVIAGEETSGIDAALSLGGGISGAVRDAAGDPVADVCVFSSPVGGNHWDGVLTGADGTFRLGGREAGDHLIGFYDCVGEAGWLEYWEDAGDETTATPVTVVAGATTAGIEAVIVRPDGGGSDGGTGPTPGVPTATLTGTPERGEPPMEVVFRGTVGDEGDGSLSWSIDPQGGAPTVTGTSVAPHDEEVGTTHVYEDRGNYRATLAVRDAEGNIGSAVAEINVGNDAPELVLDLSEDDGVAPFDTVVRLRMGDPDGDPLSYTLDWGDGSAPATGTGTTATVGHTYASEGYYAVTAVVSDGYTTTTGTTWVVVRETTTLGLSVTPGTSVTGESVTLTATVTRDADGGPVTSGTVEFLDDGVLLGAVGLDSNGEAELSSPLARAGTHALVARYDGTGTLAGSEDLVSHEVSPAATQVQLTSAPNPSNADETVSFDVDVLPVHPGGGTPQGTVELLEGTDVVATGELAGGHVTLEATLAPGQHLLRAEYLGSDDHLAAASAEHAHDVRGSSSTVLVTDPPSSVRGQAVELRATVSGTGDEPTPPSGSVQFLRGETLLATVALDGAGVATFTTASLPVGVLDLHARYQGTSEHGPSTGSVTHEVRRADTTTTVTSAPAPSASGDPVEFTVEVAAVAPGSGTPSGTVTLTDSDATTLGSGSLDAGGTATIEVSGLEPGTTTVTASYAGDESYVPSTSAAHEHVVTSPTTTTITLDPPSAVARQYVTLGVAVTAEDGATPSGDVAVTIDGSPWMALTLDAEGRLERSFLSGDVGTTDVHVRYGGSDTHGVSTASAALEVGPAGTTTAVGSDRNPSPAGGSVTFVATVTAVEPSIGGHTGEVSFLDGDTTLGTATLTVGGTAELTVALEPGEHHITAVYAGDDNFTGSTSDVHVQQVASDATTTVVTTEPVASVTGQPVTARVEVTPADPDLTATGDVELSVDGGAAVTATLDSNGVATIDLPAMDVGDHVVAARYLGDGGLQESTGTVGHTVAAADTTTILTSDPNPSRAGDRITLSAEVSVVAPGAGSPGGTVTFHRGEETLGEATLDGAGEATLEVADLGPGTHTLTAVYSGDGRFTASTSPDHDHDVAGGTVTALSVPEASPVSGELVSLTATVADSGGVAVTGGSVRFSDGGVELAVAALEPDGSATVSVRLSGAGDHTVTASYLGTGTHDPSEDTATIAVSPAGTTATLLGPTTARPGSQVEFQVAVAVAEPGSGTPTGTVVLEVGGVEAGSGELDPSGDVTVVIDAPSNGDHEVVAVYAGDADHSSSSSEPAPLRVTDTPLTATLVADESGGTAPHAVTFQVSTAGGGGPFSYTLDPADGGAALSGELPAEGLTHTYGTPGSYQAAVQVTDGVETATASVLVEVAEPEPVLALAGDDRTVVLGDPVTLDGSASRPGPAIRSYGWSLGDGATSELAAVTHTYAEAGRFTATLTVSDGSATSTDDVVVNVVEPAVDGLVVTVVTEGDASPLAGADVLVVLGDGTHVTSVTDAAGEAVLQGLADGETTVYAIRDGYRPALGTATVADGRGELTVALEPGEIAATKLESRRLTRDEIIAAGIDPDHPDNQHVFEAQVWLNIDPFGLGGVSYEFRYEGYAGAGGWIRATVHTPWGSAPCTGYCPYVLPGSGVSIGVSLGSCGEFRELCGTYLVIPVRARFLKEFFEIKMGVLNLASEGFTLTDASVALPLPKGLSLAPTAAPQTSTVSLPDIPGGESRSATWIVRGDVEGSYDLEARANAMLQPFGKPMSLVARSEEPLRVWGGSALRMIVDVEEAVFADYPYRVRVALENVADIPVYNPTIELLTEGKHNYIYQPREDLSRQIAELAPGETFWSGDFVLVPEVSGTVDLHDSFVVQTGGDVTLPVELREHPPAVYPHETPDIRATSLKEKVGLEWEPVPGADGYLVFFTPERDVDFPYEDAGAQLLTPHTTKAVVRNLPAGTKGWFAVSTIVDGVPTMHHRLVSGEALSYAPAPIITPEYTAGGNPSCGEDVTVRYRFAETFFDLAGYTISSVGGPNASGALSGQVGYSGAQHVSVAQMGDEGLAVTVTATNSDGDEVTRTETISKDCRTRKAVVLLQGLRSSIAEDPADDTFEDTFGDVVDVLETKFRYRIGETRETPSRTVAEYSYTGVNVSTANVTITPMPYTEGESWKEVLKLGLSIREGAAPKDYLDGLLRYAEGWKAKHDEELRFHLVGHSMGGAHALGIGFEVVSRVEACAATAEKRLDGLTCARWKELLGSIITVDGAVNPVTVVTDINVPGCLVHADTQDVPKEVVYGIEAMKGNWLRLVGGATLEAIGAVQRIDQDNRIADVAELGVRVATITNRRDVCLSVASTTTSGRGLVESEVFDVSPPGWANGINYHSALLHPGTPAQGSDAFPLEGYLQRFIGSALLTGRSSASTDTSTGPTGGSTDSMALSVAMAGTELAPTETSDASIAGRLVDRAGEPVTDGMVLAYSPDLAASAVVALDGTWVLEGLPPGSYRLFANPFGPAMAGSWVGGTSYGSASVFDVTGGDQVVIDDVTGVATYALEVRVVDGAAAPIGTAFVEVRDAAGELVGHDATDEGATLAVTDLAAGTYTLVTGGPEVATELTEVTIIDGPVTVDVEHPDAAAVVNVVVTDEGTGEPITGRMVTLFDGAGAVVGQRLTPTWGIAQFGGLPPGTYTYEVNEGADPDTPVVAAGTSTPVVGDMAAGVENVAVPPADTAAPPGEGDGSGGSDDGSGGSGDGSGGGGSGGSGGSGGGSGGGDAGGAVTGEGDVTTDTDGDGATGSDPVELRATAPDGGSITITPVSQTAHGGWTSVGPGFDVAAPEATADAPLELRFVVDGVRVGAGDLIGVFREGRLVPACASDAGSAARPDPCVASQREVGADVEVLVRSSRASVWQVAMLELGGIGVACPDGTPSAGFADRSPAHGDAIDCVAAWDVAKGMSADRFGTSEPVTRAQMASFLARLIETVGGELPSGDGDAFDDIGGSVHRDAIERLAAAGVVEGTGPDRYSPADPVSRGQMASLIARSYRYVTGADLPTGGTAFADVPGNVHEDGIERIATVRITAGRTAELFDPAADVTRGEMASFLARTLNRLVAELVIPVRAG